MKDRLSGRKGRSTYSQRKADPLIFGTKMTPCLWRADLSFRNSVTGSSSRAKCSNILQDSFKLFVIINSGKLGRFPPKLVFSLVDYLQAMFVQR